MVVRLNPTGNPINREERTLINQNWDKIMTGFITLQHEINMLAGDADVEDILEAIMTALDRIDEARAKVDEALEKANVSLDMAHQAIEEANQATEDAMKVAEEAHKAAMEAIAAKENTIEATENAVQAIKAVNKAQADAEKATENTIKAAEEAQAKVQEIQETIDKANQDIADAIDSMNQTVINTMDANTQATNQMIQKAKEDIQASIDKFDVDAKDAIKRVQDEIQASRQATADNKVLIDNAIESMKTQVNDTIVQSKLEISQSLEENVNNINTAITANTKRVDDKLTEANTAIKNAEDATLKAKEATDEVNLVVQEVKGWTGAEEFDRNKDYFRNNVVTYNGSTWQARRNVMGVTPSEDNKEDWILLARKGIDGQGAVASVNGLFPDTKGNIKLDAHDIDAYNRKEVDDAIKKVKEDTNIVTSELKKHNENFLAHGGDATFEITERIVNTRLYKQVQYDDAKQTKSMLSESVEGSNIYDIVTVYTKNDKDEDVTYKYKLHFDVNGSVSKTEQL